MRTKHIQPFVTLQPSGKFEVCHKCLFQRLHHDTVPQQRELLRLVLSQAEGVTWCVGESRHTESFLLPPPAPWLLVRNYWELNWLSKGSGKNGSC